MGACVNEKELAYKVSCLRRMCTRTASILGALAEEVKSKDAHGLAFAAMHLQQSLEVFAEKCVDFISLEQDDDP